ncbi:hypothetical protein AABM27_16495, partial [Heyndrickxia faecalis]|uniref:hypothetical protein n=1 Tax=Heyndrickxia faecalis TaxID=2824910 RepID=UPI003100F941
PTYSLVRFAPLHSLRMGDFFRKAVKKPPTTDNGYAAAIAESGTKRIFPSSNGSFVLKPIHRSLIINRNGKMFSIQSFLCTFKKWIFPATITVTLQQLPETGKRHPSQFNDND